MAGGRKEIVGVLGGQGWDRVRQPL
ncbi:uncharacterized protein G2W53_006437 [Senna tora]|uniref:Uncharacterized protein n=1 Tax=Senna tora TaxID=362788 RepID=A0A834X549_9FABA|nr:uncharacterized protein G2W53_006437 [Senna tora]